MDRKLAAILAADVVGYSALMERDEAGTHRRLVAGRKELFEPQIARHHGRIFKLMGDGLLAEFGSIVDAVECAVSLQRGLAERNAAVADDQRFQVRIGINLGEVIVEGDDRYGEGVNIAARLEQLAEPGGIWVSAKVAREVEKKLAFGFEAMGEQRVKNIAEPVTAYRVRLEGPPTRPPRLARPLPLRVAVIAVGMLLLAGGAVTWFAWTPAPEAVVKTEPALAEGKPSLVVLPFANLSDDKEQGYLADGITDDLTTELARVPGLFVISRNAAFSYKGKAVQPAQIAKELGVRYILEGSTRRAGEDMRLNAQLIDVETGGHVWAERFDGQWADVFALQDKVVGSIAGALKLRLIYEQGKSDTAGGTANPAAYDAYLRGMEIYVRDNTPAEYAQAAIYFQGALALDPDYGVASAMLAWLHWDADDQRVKALGLSWDEVDSRTYEFLAAASKHPSPPYYQLIASLLVRERKSGEAIIALYKAVALDPSDPWIYEGLSQALIFDGQPQQGRANLDASIRVDPGWTDWRYYQAGLAAFGEGRFEDAALVLQKIDPRSREPWPKFYGLQVLLSAYGHLGRSAEIAATKENLRTVLRERDEGEPDWLLTQQYFVFKHEADIERLLAGLGKAGVPELPADVDLRSKDRLTGAEIKSLIFGRELRGRRVAPEVADYRSFMSADGSISVTIGSWSNTGKSWVQGDFLCNAYPRNLTTCGAVFRNPSGTFDRNDEYFTVYRTNRIAFSIIE